MQTSLQGYTFIDLFAGIGGFHLALSSLGATCKFAAEWDEKCQITYETNFGIKPAGDLTKIDVAAIPLHDILCAGFPCQAFSISGRQKGFEDTRGTLFFDVARIIEAKKPKIVFLENVRNLIRHDKGNTLKVITKTLDNLGYDVSYKLLNARNFGLAQNRERIYIVAIKKELDLNFEFPNELNQKVALEDFLLNSPKDGKIIERDDIRFYKELKDFDHLIREQYPNKPIQIGRVNKGGQGERIYHPKGHAITLSAYGGGVGSRTGLYLINGKVRKLSPRECARLQGFPDNFIITSKMTNAYQQFGNSVAVNVIREVAKSIAKTIY
ncbi:DNA cytosine methyltransferase [Flammeovirga kamogawensis]|uniref:Cytosine-specific methyltransferase n=1 Tax=Flammeovirga kamogawensis TaxID=373891 RepID=A0ABX8H2V4_9BACT|nr:DNA cytosine methyltransferase [Flammeovirga kamogawensis]MBB6460226.1 DNA (cytosine-5)-methyltransferase 1 [Flammeovirga kamogawensis]QWG10038.1 DNA cytosine methyltransferase [Flammeovirga kamogawensis]TRX65545.1 DNA cytosine methyltransferase [Flammeovirga kamogawensis]